MAGRPRKYNTPEEMQIVIDNYFASCKPEYMKDEEGKHIFNKQGMPIIKSNPYTLTGLALALGFLDRQSIYDNEKLNDEYSCIIKEARLKCENFIEKGTISGEIPAAPGIFVLKNYGWEDTQRQVVDFNDISKSIPNQEESNKLSSMFAKKTVTDSTKAE
jgi:hypothetical protein